MESTLLHLNLADLKLDLLCKGIRMKESAMQRLLPPYRYKRASLSEGRSFKIGTNYASTYVNLAVYEKYVKNSPYFYDHVNKLLLKEGQKITKMEMVPDPDWYMDKLDDGTLLGSYIQLHGINVLATSLSNYCVFKDDSQECKFCGLTLDRNNKQKDPFILAKVLQTIEEKKPGKYTELNINSGTLRSDDMGAGMYISVINEIRKVSNIPLSAQIAPMQNFTWIDRFKEAGLNSLSFNIEIWDDELRQKVMPGKGKIKKSLYLDCLEYAGKVFGSSNVSSWLIAGLEPYKSTLIAAEEVAGRGVIPFVTAFRPILGSLMEDCNPPDVDTMSSIYRNLKEILEKYDLNPKGGDGGCAKCDCCSASGEVLKYGI